MTPRLPRPLMRAVLAVLALAGPAQALAEAAWVQAAGAFLEREAAGLGESVSVTLHPPNARFPTCQDPRPFLPDGARPPLGRISVGVECGGADRRTRYLQAEVEAIGRYPVTARRIETGERLSRSDLTMRRGALNRLPRQALRDPEAVVGQVARRPLAADRPFQPHQLRPPHLVDRGDRVTLEARGDGFRVTRQAEALGAGGRGERIRVRLDDRRILEGRVIGPRRLAVDG